MITDPENPTRQIPNPDFVYPAARGALFLDANKNGVRESAEKPLAGVKITLYYYENGSPADTNRRSTSDDIATTKTDGSFEFILQYAESYFLVVEGYNAQFKSLYPEMNTHSAYATTPGQRVQAADSFNFVDIAASGFSYQTTYTIGFASCTSRDVVNPDPETKLCYKFHPKSCPKPLFCPKKNLKNKQCVNYVVDTKPSCTVSTIRQTHKVITKTICQDKYKNCWSYSSWMWVKS